MAVSELHPSATITSEADVFQPPVRRTSCFVTEQPEQPQQPHMMDLILVTYNASSAFADLFRDAKNNAYGIVCHDYPGARDRPCYVGSLGHVAICFAGELSAELSKHVSPDCYMCGIVDSILVSS